MNQPASRQVHIQVNGEPVEVAAGTLPQVLQALGYDLTHAAVALNEAVVLRKDLPGTTVSDGDRVEVVAPISGG